MSKERMMILDMIESGKITPEEALVLLRALGEEDRGEIAATLEVVDPHSAEAVVQSEMDQPADSRNLRTEPERSVPTPVLQNMIGKIARILSKSPAPVKHDRRRRYPDPSFAVAMKRSGLDFSIDQLFRMEEEDIDSDQAAKMVRERRLEWTTDDIVDMLTQGACPDVLSKLNELEFGALSPRDAIHLTEHDVDPEYLERFRGFPMTGITAQDLIEFYDNDVDPALAIALNEIGLVTTREIVNASNHDLSSSFVHQIARVLPGITIRQLIELSDNDVSPDFIEDLVRGGFTNLTVKQIIHLQENDVDPKEAAWFRKNLGEQVTPDNLVRLANHDVTRDYAEPLLKLNLPDLSVDTLIKMADHDVSTDFAGQAREAYGDGFTVADLIDMADNS